MAKKPRRRIIPQPPRRVLVAQINSLVKDNEALRKLRSEAIAARDAAVGRWSGAESALANANAQLRAADHREQADESQVRRENGWLKAEQLELKDTIHRLQQEIDHAGRDATAGMLKREVVAALLFQVVSVMRPPESTALPTSIPMPVVEASPRS